MSNVGRLIIPEPAPEAPKPPVKRPYYVIPMSVEEAADLAINGVDPENYVSVLCHAAAPPQLVQPIQAMQLTHPDTGEVIGTGMLFLVPVLLPVEIPALAGGFLGADGKPIGQTQMEGPPTAMARVIVPRSTLTSFALAEAAVVDGDGESNEGTPAEE